MTNDQNANASETSGGKTSSRLKWEAAGVLFLVLLAGYFLKVSWRKWADPIVDSGMQWYSFWRISHGAALYHDLLWNYGPLSAFFNAAVFRICGPGMMVLVAANLVIYTGIVTLAYIAIRKAWGRLAAFAATGVFICMFSFLHLSQVGNYNYALPYAHESTHGMLLILVTVFVAARCRRGVSAGTAFALGLCGGLAAVLKPEFMLAGGAVGIATLALRFMERKRVTALEFVMLAAGVTLPTLVFTAWFLRSESLGSAFIDASRAWWMVLVDHTQLGQQQEKFSGLTNAKANILFQLKSAAKTSLSLSIIWAAGWCVNRPWQPVMRAAVTIVAGAVLWFLTPVGGWYSIGRSFPILVAALAALMAVRAFNEWKVAGKLEERTVMGLLLVLLAGTMLARMFLFPRIYHLGFFQGAMAGMVLAAAVVAELPRWAGKNRPGRCLATAGAIAVLATGCRAIAIKSANIYADMTEIVDTGRERFYAFAPDIDATGAVVNWTVEQLRDIPPQATVLVLPEGLMVNYLSRRVSPVPTWNGMVTEHLYVKWLQTTPPDYVVLISRDHSESGDERYGDEGNPGHEIMKWVVANYALAKKTGGDPFNPKAPKGAMILAKR